MRTPAEGLPAAARVVIAGAGIIGLSLAFELARRSVDVLVLEQGRVGSGAGGVAAGMLAPTGEAAHENPDLLRLALDSWRLYPRFIQRVEALGGTTCGYRRDGTLFIALTRDDEAELAAMKVRQERLGLATTWVTPNDARDLEPQLSPRITSALLAEDDHQVDPRLLLASLERAVAACGGRVITRARATGFETHNGRLARVVGRLQLRELGERVPEHGDPAFMVECEAAVVAAGAWSGRDLAWPAAPLGVRPVKGQLVRLRGAPLLRRVIRTPQVYLVPRDSGELLAGATMEEQGFDTAVSAGAVMDLLWHARLAVPAVYDLQISELNVGFRPATRDHLPLIGETEVPGLYVATGHFRHGVLLAPATAALLADLIVDGKRDAPALAAFRPCRPAGANPAAETVNARITA